MGTNEYKLDLRVPECVLDALRAVEDSGAVADMYDRERVIVAVARAGMIDAAAWMRANRHLYFIALFASREAVREPVLAAA